MSLFIYNGEKIEYKVIRTNRKTIVIKILPEEGVVISVPLRCSDATIQHVLNKKAAWILSKLKQMYSRTEILLDRKYETGERMKLLGDYYDLKIIEGDYKECSGTFDHGSFKVYINKNISLDNRKLLVRQVLIKVYREIAKRLLKERTSCFANILGVEPNRIVIKEQKSVWGSCSSKSNINYNWKIIMAPIGIVDYIVVHELCHLRELNHSKEFWKLVEEILPDYKVRKAWLKDYGITLDIEKIS